MKRLMTLAFLAGSAAAAQSAPRGWEMSALPATNFNSDEGFGYGITAQAYQYGDGSFKPYRYTIQPLIMLTTKGRRDVSVSFDAPHLLPEGWRITGSVAREQQLATPYYGAGNESAYDPGREAPPNPYYYRYGRTTLRLNGDVQRTVRGPLRVVVGGGIRSMKIDRTPFDSGTTLIAEETSPTDLKVSASTYRTGIVYDTRDRETGPTRGQWIDILAQRPGSGTFTRVTLTARSYIPAARRLVWAQRIVVQNIGGVTQFHDLPAIQGSFRDDEGLGGAASVRGLPKNRYIGKGVVFANEELRWRAMEFRLRERQSALIVSGFFDAGRVWESGLSTFEGSLLKSLFSINKLFAGYHTGAGVGARLAYGPNFVVAVDAARSNQGTGIYIGLGYPF
jgi:outer membrane protein assembly factor BamA